MTDDLKRIASEKNKINKKIKKGFLAILLGAIAIPLHQTIPFLFSSGILAQSELFIRILLAVGTTLNGFFNVVKSFVLNNKLKKLNKEEEEKLNELNDEINTIKYERDNSKEKIKQINKKRKHALVTLKKYINTNRSSKNINYELFSSKM